MKKIICFAFCLIFVFLCGCKKESSKVIAVTKGLSFNAVMNLNDYSTECYVKVDNKGNMKMEVIKPQNIEGMAIEFSNSNMKMNYNGLEYKRDISTSSQGVIASFLYLVLQDAALKADNVTSLNDELYISGNINGYKYKLFIGQTGLPIKIISPNGIEIIMKNVSILE